MDLASFLADQRERGREDLRDALLEAALAMRETRRADDAADAEMLREEAALWAECRNRRLILFAPLLWGEWAVRDEAGRTVATGRPGELREKLGL